MIVPPWDLLDARARAANVSIRRGKYQRVEIWTVIGLPSRFMEFSVDDMTPEDADRALRALCSAALDILTEMRDGR